MQRYRRRRGCRTLKAALLAVRAGTDSAPETELRLDLVELGLPEPEVNGIIRATDGRQIAIGDLVFRRYRVLVEYDGEQHRSDARQYHRDVDRLDDVAEEGWRVFRVNKTHRGIRRQRVLERVRAALIARGWTPDEPADRTSGASR
ncbi:DUF559 domain-containing protein [Leifsonia sp. YIM 134122]|uniref:DUF559 domain-containing protein n=1 Tax=Leifsonia stereocauli TaxID=3134136 RepID=A0ABU9W5P5_9MICO